MLPIDIRRPCSESLYLLSNTQIDGSPAGLMVFRRVEIALAFDCVSGRSRTGTHPHRVHNSRSEARLSLLILVILIPVM